ncbi:unnamed protein product, partial [Prorocentrum cordatum]
MRAVRIRRPRVVELSRMWDLYAEAYDAYRRGDLQAVVQEARRRVALVFEAWAALLRPPLGADGEGAATMCPKSRQLPRSGEKQPGTRG